MSEERQQQVRVRAQIRQVHPVIIYQGRALTKARLAGRTRPFHLGDYRPTREFGGEPDTSVWLFTSYPQVFSRFIPVVDLAHLRLEAIEALGAMGAAAPDALPALSRIADDPSEPEATRRAADEARRRIRAEGTQD